MRQCSHVHQPDAVGETVEEQRAHVGGSLDLEIAFLLLGEPVVLAEHDGVLYPLCHQLVGEGPLLAQAVHVVAYRHGHHVGVGFQAGDVFLARRPVGDDEEFQFRLRALQERDEREGEYGEQVVFESHALHYLPEGVIHVEVHDVFLIRVHVGRHLLACVYIVGLHVGVVEPIHVAVNPAAYHHRHVVAPDISHMVRGAPLGVHPVELFRRDARHEGVSGAFRHIVGEVSCHGDFSLRLLAERHADGVADAVGEQCSDAHRTLNPSVLAVSGFGNAEVQRIVHAFLRHGVHEKSHRPHHHHGVACLDGDYHVVEFLSLADAQKFHAALHDALRRVSVARHDAVGE